MFYAPVVLNPVWIILIVQTVPMSSSNKKTACLAVSATTRRVKTAPIVLATLALSFSFLGMRLVPSILDNLPLFLCGIIVSQTDSMILI